MNRLSLYFIFILSFLSSCSIDREVVSTEESNERLLANYSDEVKTSFNKLLMIISKEPNIELKGVFSTLIDFSMEDSPGNPHFVYLLYKVDKEELVAGFYTDSVTCLSIGHNISKEYADFESLKRLILKKPTNKVKKAFVNSLIDPIGYKTIETNYSDWARHMPSIYRSDTLDSRITYSVTKYNERFLPNGYEIIGKVITVGDKNEYLFYIVFKFKGQYYMSLCDSFGKLKFQRKLYDTNYMKQNQNNFCRFYLSEMHINFENCKQISDKIEIIKKDSIGIIDFYDKYSTPNTI